MSITAPGPWRRVCHTPLLDLIRKGATGSLDWRALIEDAGLPAPAAAVVEKTVRRTRLWKSERCEVARELIAHFQDGLETGVTAEALVADFGDPRQAALLIRRAKRRCRPLVWHAWWCASRATGALVAVYLVYAVYLSSLRLSPTTDYLAQLNKKIPRAPEADHAWPLYADAVQKLNREHDEASPDSPRSWAGPISEALGDGYRTLSANERRGVDDWLDAHQEELDLLRAAAAKPVFGIDLQMDVRRYPADFRAAFYPASDSVADSLLSVLLTHVVSLRDVAKVLREDMARAVVNRDSEASWQGAVATLNVARHAGESVCLLSLLVEHRIRHESIEAIRKVLRDQPDLWSVDQLRDLAHLIAREPTHGLAEGLEWERAMPLDVVQRAYSERGELTPEGLGFLASLLDGGGFDPFYRPSIGRVLLTPAMAFSLPSRDETVAVVNRFFDAAIQDAQRPLWLSRGVDPDVLAEVQGDPIASWSCSELESIRSGFERDRGLRIGVLIGIALELSRRDEGAWPESLDELTPRFLPETPVDPINGGPIAYRLVEGAPVVYSLGVDGDDDGGRLPAACRPNPTKNEGYAWKEYRPGPPLDRPMTPSSRWWEDGDWVLWSLADPRYMPDE